MKNFSRPISAISQGTRTYYTHVPSSGYGKFVPYRERLRRENLTLKFLSRLQEVESKSGENDPSLEERLASVTQERNMLQDQLQKLDQSTYDVADFYDQQVQERDENLRKLRSEFEAKLSTLESNRQKEMDEALQKEKNFKLINNSLTEELRITKGELELLTEYKSDKILSEMKAKELEDNHRQLLKTCADTKDEYHRKYVLDRSLLERSFQENIKEIQHLARKDAQAQLSDVLGKIASNSKRVTAEFEVQLHLIQKQQSENSHLTSNLKTLKKETQLAQERETLNLRQIIYLQKDNERLQRQLSQVNNQLREVNNIVKKPKNDKSISCESCPKLQLELDNLTNQTNDLYDELEDVRIKSRNLKRQHEETLAQRSILEEFLLDTLMQVRANISIADRQKVQTVAVAQHENNSNNKIVEKVVQEPSSPQKAAASVRNDDTSQRLLQYEDIRDLTWVERESVLQTLLSRIKQQQYSKRTTRNNIKGKTPTP